MKITNVRAVQPDSPTAPQDWRTIVGQILIAVDTDTGLTGYGIGGGGVAGIHIVLGLFRDLLIDRDPSDIAAHWDRMYRQTLPFGRKGLALMAQSGVDLALWDLRGKAEGVPVCRLLSERPLSSAPAYASLGADPEDAVGQGYGAIKLHLPQADDQAAQDAIVDAVARARRAIGPSTRLMTDAFMRWDVSTTLRLAEAFAEHAVEWVEEPLPPDDFTGYAELMRRSPIPIAGGEHEYTAAGFAELIDRRLHAILQPDVTWCGGLTQLIEIYRIANQAGVRVCQHRGAETWGLHAVVAFEESDPLAEAGRPWLTWLLDQPVIENGSAFLSERPGFGIRVDESALP